ncbi:MAG: glycoside hydrolase family 16 protein [Polyangiaceae bacterium]|nr:glycoside hydrolase family 16 protein [Polyangiaceae bacterium]
MTSSPLRDSLPLLLLPFLSISAAALSCEDTSYRGSEPLAASEPPPAEGAEQSGQEAPSSDLKSSEEEANDEATVANQAADNQANDSASNWGQLCEQDERWGECEGIDFSVSTLEDFDWTISTWGNENRTHRAENIWLDDSLLHLKVNGGTARGDTSVGAELVSARDDYLYGSFRVVAQGSPEPGTVFGWFYYLNDKSEIDVELLSQFDSEQKAHFTIHENIGPATHQVFDLGFMPSEGLHEYRFDWQEDRVKWFVDGQEVLTLTENVPNQPGRILVNHWTLGNDAWGGGPPVNDAIVKIRRIEIYRPR